MGGRAIEAVADDHGKCQTGQAAVADELALQTEFFLNTGAQEHHTALGIGQQGRKACTEQGKAHDVFGNRPHNGLKHLCQLGRGLDGKALRMQDDCADKNDGAGDQHHADHVDQCVGQHDAVKQIVLLPFLLFAEIGVVDTGGDGGIGGDEGKCGTEASLRNFEAEETAGKFLAVGAAYAKERDIECQDHNDDACRNQLFHLGVDVLRKIGIDYDRNHNGRADLPVNSEDQVHTRAGAGNVAHGEEQAGQEQCDADDDGAALAVILADGMDGGHSGGDGQPVGGHDKGDSHEDDRPHQPDQRVAVVGAQHGGGRDGARSDDDPGGDQARSDTLEQILQRQSLNVFANQRRFRLFAHCRFPFQNSQQKARRRALAAPR